MSINIDSLNLEISAESSKAIKSINSLIATLDRIKGAVSKASSLSSVTKKLAALDSMAKKLTTFNAQVEKINALIAALKQLNTLNEINIKSFLSTVKKLPDAVSAISNTEINVKRISDIVASLKAFETLGKSNINPFISSAKKLPEVLQALNNMPDIDSSKIVHIVSTLQTFESMGKANISPFISSAKKLPEAVSALNGMDNVDAAKLNQVVNSLRTFETLGKNNINSFLNSIKKIPTIANDLKTVDFDAFAESIQRAAIAVKPLANEMAKISSGFNALPTKIQKIIQNNANLSASNLNLSKSKGVLNTGISSLKIKLAAYGVTLKRVSSVLADYFIESNKYVENINLFTVAMGKAAEESMNFAEKVNDLLGIDISEWIRNQGIFKSITSGFGVVTDKADLMSKNLTQVAYDIASFYNIDIEETMTKVQSGISGELEPLRRLGYALDVATLQQIAYSHGIETSVNKMTQAQKSQLRYVAIMEQSKNVMGDMARTITSPANSMRVLSQQFEQLKRAIGNIISLVLVKFIPYIQAFVRLATEAAEALAKMWGFELPKFDYSGLSVDSLTDGVDDLSNALDDTAENANAVKKAMQRLAGFDEINVLRDDGTENTSADGGAYADIGASTDFDIDLPEYDFLSSIDKSSDEIYRKMKKIFQDLGQWVKDKLPLIKKLAGTIAGLWALSKIIKFWNYLKQLWGWFKGLKIVSVIGSIAKNFISGFKDMESNGNGFFSSIKGGFKNVRDNLTGLQKVAITAATTIIGAFSAHDFFYKLNTGALDAVSGLTDVAGMAGSIAAAFALTGPVGGVVTTLGVIAGAVWGIYEAQQEAFSETSYSIFYEGHLGTKISELADSYSDYIDTLTAGSETIIEFGNKNDESKKKIEELVGGIKNISEEVNSGITSVDQAIPKYKEEFEELKTETSGVLDDIYNNIKKSLSGSVGEVYIQMGGNVDNLLGVLNRLANNSSDTLEALAKEYNDTLKELEKPGADKVALTEKLDDIASRTANLVGVSSPEISKFVETVNTAFNDINFESPDSATAAFEMIAEKTKEAKDKFNESAGVMISAVETSIAQIKSKTSLTEQDVKDINYLQQYLDAIKSDKDNKIAQLNELSTQFFDKVESTLVQRAKETAEKARENWENLDWFQKALFGNDRDTYVKKQIENYQSTIMDPIQDSIKKSFDAMGIKGKTWADEALKEVLSFFDSANLSANYSDELNTLFSYAYDKVGKEIPEKISLGIKENEANVIESAVSAVVAANIAASEEAKKGKVVFPQPDTSYIFMNGIKSGVCLVDGYDKSIQKGISRIADSTSDMAQAGIDSVIATQDSHSPAKKYIELGLYAVQGYCEGITKNLNRVTRDATRIADTAISSVSAKTDFKKYGRQITDTFAKGLGTKNITVTFVNMFNAILSKMQEFENNMSKSMNTTLTNMVKSVNSVKVTNGAAIVGVQMPTITVPKMYARGGYPKQGEMFMAREDGAELVGRIGSRTAVANNDQIVESIKGGVYEAMTNARNSNSSDDQPFYIYTTVYLDNDEIYSSVDKRSRRELMRSNGRSGVN